MSSSSSSWLPLINFVEPGICPALSIVSRCCTSSSDLALAIASYWWRTMYTNWWEFYVQFINPCANNTRDGRQTPEANENELPQVGFEPTTLCTPDRCSELPIYMYMHFEKIGTFKYSLFSDFVQTNRV